MYSLYRLFFISTFFITTLILSSCSNISLNQPVTMGSSRQPVIGIALGGGGAKGFAHIGVLKVLEAQGIHAKIVTGTSAGSFVGSLYASGKTPFEIQSIAEKFEEKDIRDLTLSTQGFLDGTKLQNYVNALIGKKPIQKFPKKFAAIATRLDNGKKTVFVKGNAGQAVRASCSIPNVFVPAVIGGVKYVDGGLVSPIPVSTARKLGADIVIAVDISGRPKSGEKFGILGMFGQSISIMSQQSILRELAQADVVISPEVIQYGTLDLNQKHIAILEGEKAAQASIKQIKQAIAAFK